MAFLLSRLALVLALTTVAAGTGHAQPVLRHDHQTQGPVPIAAAERGLQTIIATPWLRITAENSHLEGPAFERDGSLIVTDVGAGRIVRVSPDRHMATVLLQPGEGMGGLAVHRDGRIFIAATGDGKAGSIGYIGPGDRRMHTVIPRSAGYVPNDLVFDSKGGFYFTDFRGTLGEPDGGVYYMAPDMKTVTPVLKHLAKANGIALSPDGKRLWVGEFAAGRLLRIDLADATTLTPLGAAVAYHFIGPAPDSMRVDSQGNLYVALYGQGRVMAFSPDGIPIGQILMPGRETGRNLLLTSLALKPDRDDLFIVTNDGVKGGGAGIFRARGFAAGLKLYSHKRTR